MLIGLQDKLLRSAIVPASLIAFSLRQPSVSLISPSPQLAPIRYDRASIMHRHKHTDEKKYAELRHTCGRTTGALQGSRIATRPTLLRPFVNRLCARLRKAHRRKTRGVRAGAGNLPLPAGAAGTVHA
jgi:hypothetical protein